MVTRPAHPHPRRAAKEATVQTTTTTAPRGALCAATDDPAAGAPAGASVLSRPLFPPRDADAETRRRWLAGSPWPEVVFATAGG